MWRVVEGPMMTGLRKLGSAVAVCILASAALHAADTPKTKKNSQLVAVRGCLGGRVLTTRQESGADTLAHQQFTLTGDRAILKQLQALSGHLIEVTGAVEGGTGHDGVRIVEKPIPKGRVYAGVGTAPVANPSQVQPPPPSTPTLDVRTVTDIDTRCN
jgi:hypothetical protein